MSVQITFLYPNERLCRVCMGDGKVPYGATTTVALRCTECKGYGKLVVHPFLQERAPESAS